ncbi:CU044_5270 family protein [Streptomyces sp. LP11]|uniref:CU044_5270 family protein n=1 Tax=Streptomyces pyxinicus TaxID=2970331 RepID=A0ABT2AYZ1_9ACTN|nr:CU044_5270 family protein [Streptomyces sp. LP11]MCS0601457.1 CU044_5270 family protein [Streptomyces sp. LP11]
MRDIDQTLRALNPVRTGEEASQSRLDELLARPRRAATARRPGRGRWAWTVTAAAVTAAVAGYLAVAPFGIVAQPALAATPAPLRPQHTDRRAADVLEEIADRVSGLPDTRPAPWQTEHFVTDGWSLSTLVDNVQVTSAVVPERRETWGDHDGSSRWKSESLTPQFQSERQREIWEEAGAVGEEPVHSSGTSGPDATRASEPPTAVGDMRAWLAGGQKTGAGLLYEVVPERFQDHVFSPAGRAALLRVLASADGIVYAGAVKDRAGRGGEAFSLTDRFGGLPNKRTLVFDPATGNLLSYEEQVLDDPGKLNVRPYSVIQYSTFLTAERLK